MEYVKWLIDTVVSIMKIPINIFGFEVSLWEIFLFSIIGSLFVWLIRGVFDS